MKKFIILGALLFSLTITGCSSIKETLAIKPVLIEKPELILTPLEPARGYYFEFTIINKENADEKFKELKESGEDIVYFALTDNGYKSLALSVAELRRYIAQQNATIRAYKEYYAPTKTPEKK
jgi:hypothetical protein|tara:strand:+ start:126 stop:494 length:369 start_codon:yes stop_codon:yes gene_type:complete